MIFKDLQVVELASVVAGPIVGQFFAELGAKVVKIENGNTGGDVTRSWKLPGEKDGDLSAYYCSINWGKQSVVVDLTNDEGHAQVIDLIRTADIVITSYKPGDADKLGVSWSNLRSLNKRLIYGQITGYGSHVDRVGYDAVTQAEGGWMSMNGERGSAPLKLPVAFVDLMAGHQLKEALLVALLRRERTGEGSFVEVSLIESALASLMNQGSNWLVAGHLPTQQGSQHPNIAPYGDVFVSADGWKIMLAIGTDRQFKDLCEALDLAWENMRELFSINQHRVTNRLQLNAMLASAIGQRNGRDLIQAFDVRKVPAGVVRNVQEAIENSGSRMMLGHGAIKGLRSFVGRNENGWLGVEELSPPPSLGEGNTAYR